MEKNERRRRYRTHIANRLLVQYLVALCAYVVFLAVGLIAAFEISHMIIWQPGPVYELLTGIREYLMFWILLGLGLGWLVISYFFLARPVRYLDEVLSAAEKLVHPDETPIHLPDAMEEVENELNLIRQQALFHARAAKEAEQRKNDMIMYLAHDLKTPLTSVIGYLSLLKEEPELPAQTREHYTGVALEKAERLEELINEFFEITRFNLTHMELERSRVDLALMLEQIVSEFQPMLREKELTCRLQLTKPLMFDCDPDKMARVFDNLLRNACSYSLEGSEIQITGTLEEGKIRLVFVNEGREIPQERLDRVFEQFFRLDASRSTGNGGAGLGLAIAKEIVELHQGSIRAESSGHTISFVLELPGSEIPAEAPKSIAGKGEITDE